MSTIERMERLDSLLYGDASNLADSPETKQEELSPVVEWDPKDLEPRLARSSYSSSLLFNGCPRKYQLQKLGSNTRAAEDLDWQSTLTFQFGHTVGDSIAETLIATKTRDQIIFDQFMAWKCDLLEENEKQKKSFFHAMWALSKFWALQDTGFFEDYEVAYYEGKPAAELSFKINFPGGHSYRGFVDLVLRHKYTGEYIILELKTNSGNFVNHNQYKNSEQAIGYSVVLDKIEPGLTNYTVEYLVYMTRLQTWESFSYPKTYTQRALWLKDRVWDTQVMDLLVAQEGSYGMWPMRGNHCVSYNRECDFLGICHMNTESLIKPLREIDLTEEKEYQFEFTIEELIATIE